MEAPKKIYLLKIPISGELDEKWLSDKSCSDDIEYIRSVVFIEKVCEFLRTHNEVDYFELIPDANYCGAGNLNKKRMIEDFKNYMKGE